MKKRRQSAVYTDQEVPRQFTKSRVGCLAAVLTLLVLAVAVSSYWRANPASDVLLQQGREALERRDYDAASRLAERILNKDVDNFDAMLLAGETAAAKGQFERALELFNAIPVGATDRFTTARRNAGNIELLHFGRLSRAEGLFREALARNPNDRIANEHLAFILGVTSRNWEVIPLRLMLIEQNRFEPLHLYLLSLSEAAMENDDLVPDYHHRVPDDPGPLVAMSRVAFEEQDYSRAISMAETAIGINPLLIEAHVKLGKAILASEDDAAFVAWHTALPVEADEHPGIWVLRANWSQRSGTPAIAIRCYWEAVLRDANHQAANYQLGRELAALGKTDEAQPFLERAAMLLEYVNDAKVAVTMKHAAGLIAAAQSAERLGLMWEAYAWLQLSLELHPTLAIDARCQELRTQYFGRGKPTTRNISKTNPALQLDLSGYPLADPKLADAAGGVITKGISIAQTSFRDDAARVGLAFRYYNGGNPAQGIRKMYEFTGGGLAILDFDCDGWPDIHLTQGTSWPPNHRQSKYRDRLFRNCGGVYKDVTAVARINEISFSQGATAGDFDNDGFPDIYVANIGRNSFFRNNGDGTFSRHEHLAEDEIERWTTSCTLADVNLDGLPDLYDVNYLTGENVYTLDCEANGVCMPQSFPAEQDQLYLNDGNGHFTNATERAGIRVAGGKGLGVVVADFEGDGVPGLFIANDSERNFFFRNTAENGFVPRFIETGLQTGLAVNGDGRAEASMGIAVGDANGDERLDIYVTNFFQESNTLYLQANASDFRDATHSAGLRDPSMQMLGFGAQFLDTDLDGWLDLFVANGHIGDFGDSNVPFRMQPQYYHNLGSGRFRESQPPGAYFQNAYLGRAVARLDWNKDGRDDLLVSYLDAKASLLTNTTNSPNNYLGVQLRGTVSSRDAVSALVRVELADRIISRQLTAGDGYQASNERRLVFGLAKSDHIKKLTVRWPSGSSQTFIDLPINTDVMLLEGRNTPVTLHMQRN